MVLIVEQVHVPPHPLVGHWLATLRSDMTPAPMFRSAMAELGRLLVYEVRLLCHPHGDSAAAFNWRQLLVQTLPNYLGFCRPRGTGCLQWRWSSRVPAAPRTASSLT